MNYSTFTTKKNDDVLSVTIDNGDVNVMSATMAAELLELVEQLAEDSETKVVVFDSANAEFFIAHFDISDIVKMIDGDESIPTGNIPGLNILQALVLSIQDLPQVTVAKVDGICRGGGFEFILAMDMCFASEQSKFCFPEASAGFLPAGGGSTLLPIRAGNQRALEVMLTGRDYSGAEAERYNIVNRSFATAEELNDYVASVVKQMCANSSSAIQAVKSVPKETFALMKDGMLAGMTQENVSMGQCLSDPVVNASIRKLAENSGTRDTELNLPDTIANIYECSITL